MAVKRALVAGITCLSACTLAAGAKAAPPHLVFMLGDEVGWNNVGWHSNITLTPRMTELAKTGVILDRHYVQRWCAPTRTAFTTGRYPYNVGFNLYGHGVEEERSAVPSAFDMLPKVLKRAPTPYRTHMLGKWHLGFFTHAHTPVGRGFDTQFGFFLGDSTHDTRGSQVSHTCGTQVVDLYNSTHIANTTDYYRNHEYNTYMYAGEADRLIHDHAANFKDSPFFLYMAFQNCHAPYQVPTKYRDMYPALPANQSQRCFNALVSAMDESVGTIVDALKATAMYSTTILVYSSDNGGPAKMSNNMPLRGAKFGLFEGSFRVPCFVHSPLLPPRSVGTTSAALVFIADWYLIFARLAGVEAGAVVNGTGPVAPDGVDTWDAIVSQGHVPSPRTMIVHEYNVDVRGGYVAIRSGDYKLIYGDVGTSEWIADVSYPTGCTALLPPINLTQFLDGTTPAEVLDPAGLFPSPDDDREDESGRGDGREGGGPVLGSGPGPGSGLSCTEANPCLFDVEHDPTEQDEIAAANPAIVARLKDELAAYVKGRYTGGLDVAKTSEDDYCKLIKAVKWVQPYDDGEFPPAPPSSTPP